MNSSIVCISHRKDVDGLGSAALVKSMTDARVILVNYSDLVSTIESVTDECKELYVCDLGLNESTTADFVKELRRLKIGGTRIHYVDHHPIRKQTERELIHLGVDFTHSLEECTAVQVYLKFQQRLKPEMKSVVCYSAITDYMDFQPCARALIQGFDRQFLLLEASLIAYAAALKGRDLPYLLRLVDELSAGRVPHEIPGVVEDAKKQADNALKILSYVRTKGKTMKNIAYVETDETSTGNVANFLIGAFSKPVGVSFREETAGTYEVSLRGGDGCRKHLGNIVAGLAKKFGGAGGGHAKASGASIPKEQIEEFLVALDSRLE